MSKYDYGLEAYLTQLSPAAQSLFLDGGTPCGSTIMPGWWPVIRDALENIAKVSPGSSVDQIKEKFGGLRLYITPGEDNAWMADHYVDQAQAACWRLCCHCGTDQGVSTKGPGWISTECDSCRQAPRK